MSQVWVENGWVQMAIVSLWLGLVILVEEGLRRFAKAGPEVTRKVVHIGAGNVILLAWWLQVPAWMGLTASALLSGITLFSYWVPLLPGVDSVGRKSLGTFFYAVSIGVLIALFWRSAPQYAVMGILVMTWGDGLAALIGQRWGKHHYRVGGIQKSWEGSLTMGLVSFAVTWGVLLSGLGSGWQSGIVAGLVAIAVTGLEAFSRWGIDNLTVPLGAATIGFWLGQYV